jgi:hypothetical protein
MKNAISIPLQALNVSMFYTSFILMNQCMHLSTLFVDE